MKNISLIIFLITVSISYILFVATIWSVVFPNRRIWPPPNRKSWQYRLVWGCYYLVFLLIAVLGVLDWNSGLMKDYSRLFIGIPITITGTWLVTWGITTLGIQNTSGLPDKFVKTGPYRFTRNPQYLGDSVMFVGLSLMANSTYLWIILGLLTLIFLITPFAEEVWLEEQYGEKYLTYKENTSRFL